jgi:hypothetical protein
VGAVGQSKCGSRRFRGPSVSFVLRDRLTGQLINLNIMIMMLGKQLLRRGYVKVFWVLLILSVMFLGTGLLLS